MSKITFRADDALVDELEALDLSKSEAMRQALRSYLGHEGPVSDTRAERNATTDAESGSSALDRTLDELVRERVDELVAEQVASLVGQTSPQEPSYAGDNRRGGRVRNRETQDINVTVSLAGQAFQSADQQSETHVSERASSEDPIRGPNDQSADSAQRLRANSSRNASGQPSPHQADQEQTQSESVQTTCGQCGEPVDDDHVYCPNCGEKSSRRLFCECGDEFRSDWSFCPGCGRRTPAADVLESR
ncbi:double zinc ribbon domain-containing protein [Natrialba asiatica]|uniref:CopG family transcriptional regulator n=1 Tax=Natrialba asiatica (strain ATCC 700177 / DSM 12278 / JCM 9576 / FERM P-10747 / NBRC 102637 / 172P1) TaxID=29540 RepID=M0AZE7_NATA1|nr:zinc ribbon domain-containing protein [Natrialba asiatica]ELZ02814.1 CopG family transcriptional regulator [Natrialba asiatica DSM 12278]